MAAWISALTLPLVALVVPGAILIGQFWRNGALIVTGAGALAAFGAIWTMSVTNIFATIFSTPTTSLILTQALIYLIIGGALLLIAGWAIALVSAAQARRWLWVGALIASVYLSVVLVIYISQEPYPSCLFSASGQPFCATYQESMQAQFLTACVVGPASILAYALIGQRALHALNPLRPRSLPEGLTATSLEESETAGE